MKGFLDNYCMVNGHCDCMRRLGHAIQTHRLYPQACEYLSLKQLPKEQIQLYTKQMVAFEAQSDKSMHLNRYKRTLYFFIR